MKSNDQTALIKIFIRLYIPDSYLVSIWYKYTLNVYSII